MSIDPHSFSSLSSIHVEQAAAAYQRMKPAADAVPEKDLLVVRTDVTNTVSIGIGAWPGVAPLVRRMEALPDFDARNADELVDRALALWHTQIVYMAGAPSADDVQRVADQAATLKGHAMRAADMFVEYGIFPSEAVDAIRAGTGHRDTATDLGSLVNLFRTHWAQVQGKSPITESDLTEMELTASTLLALVSVRDGGQVAETAAAAKDRQRAYTLFVTAYDQVRRAVQYLRFAEGDADTIAPSIYQHDAPSGKKSGATASTASASAPASVNANATSATSTVTAEPSVPVASISTAAVVPPAKGGGPFIS